jgi:hypothetical protein
MVMLRTTSYSCFKSEGMAIKAREIRMGYGACSVSGCPCQSYVQTYGSELCSNCGHKYTDHW